MNKSTVFVIASIVIGLTSAVCANEAPERAVFGKWHVGIGAAFNARVDADVGVRNLPAPAMYMVPADSTKAKALERALARQYDGGGYVADDGRREEGLPGDVTENWKLPVSAYTQGTGHFDLENSYQEVIGSSFANDYRDRSDTEMQYGISLELSRELWIHDEQDEHRWGVDFVAAFSYFFRRDLYKASGTYTRTDAVRDGKYVTPIDDPNAMGEYDPAAVGYPEESPTDFPVGGMYGHGNSGSPYWCSPALSWSGIGLPDDKGGAAHPVSSSYGYNANGDYQELEMLFMLRPWYEITDWWRVFAEVGVGVSWGRFDSSFHGPSGSYDEDFSQWDCYGVAGLGTSFRYERYTLSVDFLARFLRDDLDVNGKYLNGEIDRADWGFRVMLGFEF